MVKTRKFIRDGRSLTYHLVRSFKSKSKAKKYAIGLGCSTYRIHKNGSKYEVYRWK